MALHFDQLPAAWLVYAAPSFLPDGVSELSAWPVGEPLARLDSFLFLGIAFLLGGTLPGLLVTNLFVLLGPPLSAWAAARFAREALGVGLAGALVAGASFGFAPLATIAALEGHIYTLFDPWLPLCALYTWRGQTLRAVGCFALTLLTTAYLGVDALLVLLAVLWHQRRFDLRLLGGVGAVGAVYAGLYVFAGPSVAPGGGAGFEALLRVGAATATTLVAWAGWMDLSRHSLAPALGLLPLCFALLAPLAGVRVRPWLPLGILAAVLALGPVIELGVARESAFPTLLYPFFAAGVFAVFRFPIRFAWISALALGALAGATVDRMRFRWVAVALAVVDVWVFSGAAFRMRPHPTPTPAVYALVPEAPLLDLYPQVGGAQEDIGFYQQNLSCYYQAFHHRPLLDRCLNTDIRASPRAAATATVHAALLEGRPALPALHALGVGSVVVHADLYQPFERATVSSALTTELGPPIGEGHDGGEWLIAWRVPDP